MRSRRKSSIMRLLLCSYTSPTTLSRSTAVTRDVSNGRACDGSAVEVSDLVACWKRSNGVRKSGVMPRRDTIGPIMTDREKFENTKALLMEIYREFTYAKSHGPEGCLDGLLRM